MDAKQIVNYISVYKAKCKSCIYEGRRRKLYEIEGTIEANELKRLRENLSHALGY